MLPGTHRICGGAFPTYIMPKCVDVLDTLSLIAEDVDISQMSNRARLAAGLVYRNKIVAIGTNQKKSHPFQKKYSKNENSIYLHAEICAIVNALKRVDERVLSKSSLYVCRVKHPTHFDPTFTWGMAKPCVGCQRAIAAFGIRKVYYSCEGIGNYDML